MIKKTYLSKLAADVTKRCGICQATVEQVLPALFDEIRYRLTEGDWPCVVIESFGTFGVVTKPERMYHNTRKGKDEWRTLPEKKVMKFFAANNMRREMEAGRYDPSRHSFDHHPDDPPIRTRKKMAYRPLRDPIPKGQIIPVKNPPNN